MTDLEAIILGIVQGVFMFVPVSSTAHLVITQHAMISAGSALPAPDSPQMILFDLIVHVGTLVSIAIVFRRSLTALVVVGLGDAVRFVRPKPGRPRLGPFLKLGLLGLLTVLVTGLLGLALKSSFEAVFGEPRIIAVTLTVTAILLYMTDRLGTRPFGVKKIGPRIAIIIGIAQAMALIPGISRSGMTIIAGLFAGLKRRWAAEYSFIVAIPTILAASLVQAVEVRLDGGLDGIGLGPLLVAFVVSAVVGTVALRIVLALLYRARLRIFSIYLICFALAVAFGAFDGIL